jgi:hypothetical protein
LTEFLGFGFCAPLWGAHIHPCRRGATPRSVGGSGTSGKLSMVSCPGGRTSSERVFRDRSVLVTMRRRAPGERVEPFRRRRHEPPGTELGDRLAEWADEHRFDLDGYEPDNPLEDRPADVWEPLLAIGDHAWRGMGGSCPQRCREPHKPTGHTREPGH